MGRDPPSPVDQGAYGSGKLNGRDLKRLAECHCGQLYISHIFHFVHNGSCFSWKIHACFLFQSKLFEVMIVIFHAKTQAYLDKYRVAGVLCPFHKIASKKVSVPSVIGKTEEEAKTTLNSLGLGYKATYQPSNTIPEGTVISQGTSSGTKVAKNTTITLSISSGPESSSVPNVVGQDQVGASSLLESAGFKVSVKQSYSDSVEQGKVISQSPSGSTTVSPGSTVTITVSQGKETKMVTVPNVVGMNSTDAQNTLTSLGLNYSIVETKDTNVEKGKVISTSPSAGQQVEEGTSVKIYVSKGQETTTAASGNGAGNNNSGSGNNTGNNSQQRAAGSN